MVVQPGSTPKKAAKRRARQTVDLQVESRLPRSTARLGFRRRLLAWFDRHGRRFRCRRKSASLYQLIVTEALLQRTRAETVDAFYAGFFKRFPSWKSLAAATESELQEQLKPIG